MLLRDISKRKKGVAYPLRDTRWCQPTKHGTIELYGSTAQAVVKEELRTGRLWKGEREVTLAAR